jgi:hypothetical protein
MNHVELYVKNTLELMMNHVELYAYALGYYDGRTNGVENAPIDEKKRVVYIMGFDRGVSDYCEIDVDSTGE